MSKKKKLFLHLGYSKTATTWLQKNIFPNFIDLNYVTIEDSSRCISSTVDDNAVSNLNDPFNLSPFFWRDYGVRFINNLFDFQDSPVLLSDENITLGRGLFRSDKNKHPMSHKDPFMLAGHLIELKKALRDKNGTGLKVILVVRKQDEWLASRYAQSSKFIVNASQADFESQVRQLLSSSVTVQYQEGQWLNYDRVYGKLVEAIGEENVLLLPYEMLKNEPETFVQSIERFTDSELDLSGKNAEISLKTNVRSQKRDGVKFWKLRSRRFRFLNNRVGKMLENHDPFPKYISVSEEFRREILENFKRSNKELSDKLGLKLESYGYF